MKKTSKKGFTIVELVIVIAVIAILAAVLIPTFSGVVEKGQVSAAMQNAKNEYEAFVMENAETLTGDENFVIVSGDYEFYVTNGQFDSKANDKGSAAGKSEVDLSNHKIFAVPAIADATYPVIDGAGVVTWYTDAAAKTALTEADVVSGTTYYGAVEIDEIGNPSVAIYIK